MIWVITIIMMVSFILSGVFVGFTPALHNVIEKDFLRQAVDNAYLESLQYGNLVLRAKTVIPSATKDFTLYLPNTPPNTPIPLMQSDGETLKSLECKITIPRLTYAKPDPEIQISITEK